jgi:sRNA-binding carbon storage regulator CsrA
MKFIDCPRDGRIRVGDVVLTLVNCRPGRAAIGVVAPRGVAVDRAEVSARKAGAPARAAARDRARNHRNNTC